jgi:hypothetical protein
LVVTLLGYILFNAVRATLGPVQFAQAYGVPFQTSEQVAFVYVYAIRALFLGVYGLALLRRGDLEQLSVFSLIAAIMPVGDIILVAQYGAALETLMRHVLAGVFLLLTWYLLRGQPRLWRSSPSITTRHG